MLAWCTSRALSGATLLYRYQVIRFVRKANVASCPPAVKLEMPMPTQQQTEPLHHPSSISHQPIGFICPFTLSLSVHHLPVLPPARRGAPCLSSLPLRLYSTYDWARARSALECSPSLLSRHKAAEDCFTGLTLNGSWASTIRSYKHC